MSSRKFPTATGHLGFPACVLCECANALCGGFLDDPQLASGFYRQGRVMPAPLFQVGPRGILHFMHISVTTPIVFGSRWRFRF